eukprot:38150_1
MAARVIVIIDEILNVFDVEQSSSINEQTQCNDEHMKCICGIELIKYNGNVICDACGLRNQTEQLVPFWHCNEMKSQIHPKGYDICDNCCNQYFNMDFDTKIEWSHQQMLNVMTNNNPHSIYAGYGKKCLYSIDKCPILIRLTKEMQTFINNINSALDEENLLRILNDYLHLMKLHDNDTDFQYINNLWGICDILKCDMYRRNNREEISVAQLQINDEVYKQIMNGIHCYFTHCFDIGHRLTIKEKQIIENMSENNSIFRNNQLIKTMKILASKTGNRVNNCRYNKFSQLDEDSKIGTDHDDKFYSFGYNFYYGYESYKYKNYKRTKHLNLDQEEPEACVTVSAKYQCFKKELTSNKLSVLTIDQFNNSYRKAQINCRSTYCKRHVTLRHKFIDKTKNVSSDHPFATIKTEYILAVMIYCSYDNLQFKFSETYRKKHGKEHGEYYWLGRYLKRAVLIYGQKSEKYQKFYHGISQKLLFPEYCGGSAINVEVRILCPLSTSLSFEVAANFSNQNQGLVVEFGGFRTHFPCQWLSRYSSERECLFLQMSSINNYYGYHGLEIFNIFDFQAGVEYDGVASILKKFKKIINYEMICEDVTLSSTDCALLKVIIENQLSKHINKYSPFVSLSEYGQEMCDIFFNELTVFKIDYEKWQRKYPSMVKMLFLPQLEWLDINLLLLLIPNIKDIEIKNSDLCRAKMEYIISSTEKDMKNIQSIKMTIQKKSKLSIEATINEFSNRCSKRGVYISGSVYSGELVIYLSSIIQFIGSITQKMGQHYCKFDCKCLQIIQRLKNEQCDEKEQELFYKYCEDVEQLIIDWRDVETNPDIGIFKKFYYSDFQWIKMNMVKAMFPYISQFEMRNIRLDKSTFDSILDYYKKNNNSFLFISIKLNSYHMECVVKEKHHEICRQLTNFTSDEDIFQHDWNSFDVLYEIRDTIVRGNDDQDMINENLYHVDMLIAAYGQLKYENIFKSNGLNMIWGGDLTEIQIMRKNFVGALFGLELGKDDYK